MNDTIDKIESEWYAAFMFGRGDKPAIKARLQAMLKGDNALRCAARIRTQAIKSIIAARGNACHATSVATKLYDGIDFSDPIKNPLELVDADPKKQ